jgi:hypothetical protein
MGGGCDPLTFDHTCHMVFHMKTTLNIDEHVMKRLREEAARRGTTMSELVEAGLRLVLEPSPPYPKDLPPLPRWDGGMTRVDLSNRDALLDWMDRG